MSSSFWLSRPTRRNSQGNFVMEIWNQLSSVIFSNAGLKPAPRQPKLSGGESSSQGAEAKKSAVRTLTQDECNILSSGSFKSRFGYRTFESACSTLKMARTQDARLQGKSVGQFYQHLELIQSADFSTQSFVGKTVVAVEGLEGSGKSALIHCIASHCPNLEVVSAQRIQAVQAVLEVFRGMPDPVFRAFQCAVNYMIAFEILQSPSRAFLVESYHHAVCARIVGDATASADGVTSLPAAVFDWPFDLPLPELVLYLSVPTEMRMMRLKRTADGVVTERGLRANMVYSMVRGPGTVGLDASLPADEVAYTALEALEYYGVYAISRSYDPSYVNPAYPSSLTATGDGGSAASVEPDDPMLRGEIDVRALSPLTASGRDSGRTTTGRSAVDKQKQKRRSSLCFRPGRRLSSEFDPLSGEGSDENADPRVGNVAVEVLPELPEEAIKNRRISMGVYGMFTAM